MQKEKWQTRAAVVITLFGVAVAVYLLGRFLLPLLLPFLLSFLLALLTRPLVMRLAEKSGWSERLCGGFVTFFALLLIGILLFFAGSRLLGEARDLVTHLLADSQDPDGDLAHIRLFFEQLMLRLPFLEHLREFVRSHAFFDDPAAFWQEQLGAMLTALAERIPSMLSAFLKAFPAFLLFLLVTVISSFYMAMELCTVKRTVCRLLPPRLAALLPRLGEGVALTVKRYLRAYLLLFLLTFSELALGFFLLRVDYALLLALLTALLDILPVLGVGVVLIPLAIFRLITGDTLIGVLLLVLYGVITVVRQIAEPRLVGKSLGLHPILMLLAFYVGLGLFGVAGVFIGPVLAMVIKALLDRRSSGNSP